MMFAHVHREFIDPHRSNSCATSMRGRTIPDGIICGKQSMQSIKCGYNILVKSKFILPIKMPDKRHSKSKQLIHATKHSPSYPGAYRLFLS